MHITIFSLWIVLSIGIYIYTARMYATWIVLIVGWIILPPAFYQATGYPEIFPFWIVGSALPSDLLVTKAWVAPAIAVIGSIIFDRQRWSKMQFHWTDLAVTAFCFWPIMQSLVIKQPEPSNILSCLYLIGVWGMPWLIGRLYLRDFTDLKAFASVLALATLAMIPLMFIEGVSSFRIHTIFFNPHPFAFDGMERYIGFRPQLFFEHGNQYGLWCAGATTAAYWRLRVSQSAECSFWRAVFCGLLAVTLASQSIGAILLLLGALALLSIPNSFKVLRPFGALVFAAALLLGSLHVSGLIPLRSIAEKTVVGKSVVNSVRAMGRGSFIWRLGQDVKALPIIQKKLVTGSGRWDWFMSLRSRPWGLPLLLIGQFGLISFALLIAALLGALHRHLVSAALGSESSKLVTVLVLMFGIDAFLNSFVFYPAILVASAYFRSETMRKAGPLIVEEDCVISDSDNTVVPSPKCSFNLKWGKISDSVGIKSSVNRPCV